MIRRKKFTIKETVSTIIADEKYIPLAEQEICLQRKYLEEYILRYPQFARTFKPFPVGSDAPEIVQRMAESSAKMRVGPMAAVAGAISEYAVRSMIKAGASHAIVDNGGDIALYIDRPFTVGLYSGRKKLKDIALRFLPESTLIGISTSSATIGPSISLGKADATTVISKDVILADAAATALGNQILNQDNIAIKATFEKFLNSGIQGMIIIIEDTIGFAGDIPEIVNMPVDIGLITKP